MRHESCYQILRAVHPQRSVLCDRNFLSHKNEIDMFVEIQFQHISISFYDLLEAISHLEL